MTISKLFKKREQIPDIETIIYNPAYEHPRLENETDTEYRERLKDIWLKRLQLQCK